MRKFKRKRSAATENEPDNKKVCSDDDEETNNDSASEIAKTGSRRSRRIQLTEPKGRRAESDVEALNNTAKRTKKNIEVEAILSNKQFKGKTKYLLKWKDGSESWETKKKTTKVCPVMLREYTEEAKKMFEVEAIVSQRVKNCKIKYLIKWKDYSKGETWETEFRAMQLCPELVSLYVQEMEIAKQKEKEVEAIVDHKKEHNKHKYLIKWKDHSKGETWESGRKAVSLCPDILNEFTKDRPEAVPPTDYFNPALYWYKSKDRDKRLKKRRRLFSRKKLSDDEDDDEDDDEESDENNDWEVARIVRHRKKGKSREFLIRWKGYKAEDDTWEAERDLNCPDLIKKYLSKVGNSKRLPKKR